jgi:hypothetical protein
MKRKLISLDEIISEYAEQYLESMREKGNLKFLKRVDNKIFFFDRCQIIPNYLQ